MDWHRPGSVLGAAANVCLVPCWPHRAAPSSRHRTALRSGACTALGAIGELGTLGCLLALFLANLSFFGERPHVPVLHTALLLTGAVAGIGVPALVSALILTTWRQRLVVAAVMLIVLLLEVLSVGGLLGV